MLNFPTANPLQANNGGGSDVFIAKLNPTGSAFVYSTYFPILTPLQPACNSAGFGCGDIFIAKIIDPAIPLAATADYNEDGKADIAVYRPCAGEWFAIGAPIQTFGSPLDISTPGDYNGDSLADPAFFRPATGEWHVLLGGVEEIQVWGVAGDIAVPGDYDGDQKTDRAIWRPSTGEYGIWDILPSGNGVPQIQVFGKSRDFLVPPYSHTPIPPHSLPYQNQLLEIRRP